MLYHQLYWVLFQCGIFNPLSICQMLVIKFNVFFMRYDIFYMLLLFCLLFLFFLLMDSAVFCDWERFWLTEVHGYYVRLQLWLRKRSDLVKETTEGRKIPCSFKIFNLSYLTVTLRRDTTPKWRGSLHLSF